MLFIFNVINPSQKIEIFRISMKIVRRDDELSLSLFFF